MRTVVWLTEGTWETCVDAAIELALDDVALLHVLDAATLDAWTGGPAGLLGRGGPAPDEGAFGAAAEALLQAAAERFGAARSGDVGSGGSGPVERLARRGRVEDEVVAACEGADLLVCARDGDRSHRGPRSLSPPTRFVVDHAPCQVLLVWPGGVPSNRAPGPPPGAGPHPHPGPRRHRRD